jgi:hypothetical protein
MWIRSRECADIHDNITYDMDMGKSGFQGMKAMAKHRTHSSEFKRQITPDFIAVIMFGLDWCNIHDFDLYDLCFADLHTRSTFISIAASDSGQN